MAARLVPLNGGASITLDKPIILIGRHPECDAVLQKSTKVSRRHCCVAQVNNRYIVRDLGSMNGVRLNGERVTEAELRLGDELAIGDQFFTLKIEEGAPRKAPPAQTKPPEEGPFNRRVGVKMSFPPPESGEVKRGFPMALPSDSVPEPALSDSGYHGNIDSLPLSD